MLNTIICSRTNQECEAGIDCNALPECCGCAVDENGKEIEW